MELRYKRKRAGFSSELFSAIEESLVDGFLSNDSLKTKKYVDAYLLVVTLKKVSGRDLQDIR